MAGHFPRLMLLAVLVIATVTAAFYTWRAREALEGFDEEEVQAVISDEGTGYDRRLYVMKLFDALLRRKATAAELEEFSKIGTDAEVLKRVIDKTGSSTDKIAAFTEPEVRAPTPVPPPAPTPVPTQVPTSAPVPVSVPAATAKTAANVKPTAIAPPPPSDQVCLDKAQLLQSVNDISDRLSGIQSMITSM